MRLATRMALCLTLLAGLLIATSLYQLRLVERIHSISRDLGDTNVEVGRVSVRLLQGVEGVREFAQKSVLLGDPDYVERWNAWERSVQEELAALQALTMSGEESARRERLAEAWHGYEASFVPPVGDTLPRLPPRLTEEASLALLDSVELALASIRTATEELMAENEASVARRTEESVLAVDRAHRTARLAGGGSLVLAILLSLALFFVTQGPLRRLNRGTREIAGGNFSHRIPVRGGDELSKLAEDFNKMASKLGEVDELKKDFVSHVSHELKGPLAAIQETHLILLERIPGPLTDKQAHLLELSHQSANRLSVMIGNLLGVSRLESGSMQAHFEIHDVAEITCDVVNELSALASERALEVHLQFDPSTSLWCDPERLREVVANLVGNAYKFSPRGAPVRIGWRLLEAPPARVARGSVGRQGAGKPYLLLSVEDQGTGVPDAHKEGIFEKFYQVRRHTRTRGGGVGLGLAIARKIVEVHGGRIWVEDGEAGGSRFLALFPGAVPAPAGQDGPANGRAGAVRELALGAERAASSSG